MLFAIRCFFHNHDFLEVETPLRVITPALELHIDAETSGEGYLRTSPELHMKRLLSAGYKKIFQLGPCFRKGELGDLHHPEYSMLEWYESPADYMDILKQTKSLMRYLTNKLKGTHTLSYQGQKINLDDDWPIYSVSQLFNQHAGWDPAKDFNQDRFDQDLVTLIEPKLPKTKRLY